MKTLVQITQRAHIYVKHKQLAFYIGQGKEEEQIVAKPSTIEGIVAATPHITLTGAAIATMSQHNIFAIFVNDKRQPCAILRHYGCHVAQTQYLRKQVAASAPTLKQLWKQIIQAKIARQVALLKRYDKPYSHLKPLVSKVRSGDKQLVEAQAARRYFPLIFGSNFIRVDYTNPINTLLNYGYQVLYAYAARALAAAGLLPEVGINHCSKSNIFGLASDVMEPYRPMIDDMIITLIDLGYDAEDQKTFFRELLASFTERTFYYEGKCGHLPAALERTALSLREAYMHNDGKAPLYFPTLF
jgi:CRISPR-associated protein Cas1